MTELPNYMRITGVQVSDDDVDSRKAAIISLKNLWGKITKVDMIFTKAADVANSLSGDGTPSQALGKEVEIAIQKKASAFLYAERPLDVGIVAGMVARQIISDGFDPSGWSMGDAWAGALWSALGFQAPLPNEKREALRASVLSAARARAIDGAERARKRVVVPDFGEVPLAAGKEAELGSIVKKATGPTIDALRRNAALDREELDFLWWAQLRRSRLLNRPLNSINEIACVVVNGIEGAGLLRRMPSEVHREIVLRTMEANSSATLGGVLEALATDRQTLAALYAGGLPPGGTTLFPLLTAILAGEVDETPASKISRSAEDWGGRALLEAALVKMRISGPAKL